MSIRSQRSGDLLVLAPGHKLTVSEDGRDLADAARVGLAEGVRRFVFDLSEVEFIDSQGVGEIVSGYISIRNAGAHLVLCGLQARAALVLRMANLHMVLDIQDAAPDAVTWA